MADHKSHFSPMLREARLRRGLTQQEVADRVQQLAWLEHKRRVGVNADMVSKWERGDKRPSAFYRRLLCQLYDASDADLGLSRLPVTGLRPVTAARPPISLDLLDVVGPGVELLQASIHALWKDDMLNRRQLLATLGLTPAAIGLKALDMPLGLDVPSRPQFQGAESVAMLESTARRLEAAYHLSHPERLLIPSRALAASAEHYLDAASTRLRRALLQVIARAQLLTGRLTFFDLHRPMEARAHLDLAREAAIEAQDPLLVSSTLGHMAFLPAEHHQMTAASSYLDAARDALQGSSAHQVAGWIEAVASEIRAKEGDHAGARAVLSRAREELARSTEHGPEWFDYFDEGRLYGFEGFALRQAGSLSDARSSLEEALARGTNRIPKQRAVTMLDLASVRVEQDDIDAGCALATDAVQYLREAGYATGAARLCTFYAALPDHGHPAARLLREAIAELS